ncbi:MAG TPA: hypothetical protein VGO52_14545 [Hyphomonadaceae bacterium]|jgi:hypothetical protein|nr:hypothetical protein [Hyphomonadaceae bacterium]
MPYDIGALHDAALDPAILARVMPKPVTRPKPKEDKHRWEGRLKGETGSARKADFHIIAQLCFCGGAVSGKGSSPEFPYSANEDQRTFAVSGSEAEGRVAIEVRFDHGYFQTRPFILSGELDAERKTMTGAWTYRCGPDCDCGGSTGRFELKRVEE